jgi:hypothetical protein
VLPTSPDVRRNLVLGILVGLALGVGLAMIRHALDTKIRTENDVQAASDRPVLAQVPLNERAAENPISLEDDPSGLHAESIRRLRTNLMFVDVTTGKHAFVLTSAMPGEGKTTTTINLARAIADNANGVACVVAKCAQTVCVHPRDEIFHRVLFVIRRRINFQQSFEQVTWVHGVKIKSPRCEHS